MKKQQFIYIVCLAALVSGCNIYKPYSRPEMDTKGLYRDPVSATDTLVSDTTNMGDLPWREVFTDPQLQSLIQLGLEQNTDLQTAILKVQEAEAGRQLDQCAGNASGGIGIFHHGKTRNIGTVAGGQHTGSYHAGYGVAQAGIIHLQSILQFTQGLGAVLARRKNIFL